VPGIIGLISSQDELTLFSSMIESINHFNYKWDKHASEGIHLGRVYHSFLPDEVQPRVSSDKRYMIVFDGEIFSYNNEQLSDGLDFSQFFLHKFLDDGIDCFKKMNGHFQACVYDQFEKKLFLIADRFSTKPLYYTVHKNRLLFAPEVKALLKDTITKKVNHDAISDLFHFGHLFGYKTLFKNIFLLPEASYLILENGESQLHRYWDYPYVEKAYELNKPNKKKVNDYSERLENLLETSVKQQTLGQKDKFLIPLSGGLDSRWMVSLVHDFGIAPISSFTMGSEETEDRKYAAIVAQKLKIDQTYFEIEVTPIWEDSRHYSYISDAMSMIYGPIQNFQPYRHYQGKKNYVITPQMCDAIFGSTLFKKRLKNLTKKKTWDIESERIFIELFSLFDSHYLKLIFNPDIFESIAIKYRDIPFRYIEKDKKPIFCYFKLLLNEHGRRGTLGGNIVNNLFFQTRMPSYDNNLVDFAFNLPIYLKQNQYLYRHAFNRKYKKLASIPRQGTNLPINVSNIRLNLKQFENKVINRAKKTPLNNYVKKFNRWNKPSYIRYSDWFKNELRFQTESLILDKQTIGRGIFIEDGLKKVLNEHFTSKVDHHRLIWQIINLELFFRNFID
jgi:asparagine synthase (glutamine-hydrolysing)